MLGSLVPLRLHNVDSLLVLLLDEADVFLEERSLQDLERNSLVSGKAICRHEPCRHLLTLIQCFSAPLSIMTAF